MQRRSFLQSMAASLTAFKARATMQMGQTPLTEKDNPKISASLSHPVSTLAARPSGDGPVSANESGTTIRLGNDFLERTVEFEEGFVRTTNFRNKVSGRLGAVSGNEFELRVISDGLYRHENLNPVTLTSRDFRLVDHDVKDGEDGGKTLAFHLTHPWLNVTLMYQLKPHDFFTRKWMKIDRKGKGTLFIGWIAAERNKWYAENFSDGGFGQPLLTDDLFFGLEYPSSMNTARRSLVTLAYYVGIDIPPEGYTTESAVIGATASGYAHIDFMKYVNKIRMAQPRPFVLFDSWDDLPGPMVSSASMIKRIADFKENLTTKYGVRLDSVVLDDQWDDLSNLWAINRKRFPGGFHDIEMAAKSIGSGLGVWFSPMGGYGKRREERIAQGIREGMEVNSSGKYFCLAGEKYSPFFRHTVLKMEDAYHINLFKMDGVHFSCNVPCHGHPLGIYAREAAIRDWIATLKALHAANSRAYLDNATGPWLSPWWLLHCDDVDYGGEDMGIFEAEPTITPRQAAINYNDAFLYQIFRVQHVQFPISSLEAVGIHKGRYNFPQFKHESLDDWKDVVVNYVSVGIMKIGLYISPELLSPEEWQVLAQSLRWSRQNAHPLLDNSTMVLGDPGKREPYGYLHFTPAKGIVALRNPYIQPRTISLKLDKNAGVEPTDRVFQAEIQFPYRKVLPGTFGDGDTLQVDLDGYEQCVVELNPVKRRSTTIVGVRYSTVTSNATESQFRLYGAEGTTEVIGLPHVGDYREIQVDGAPVKVGTEGSQGKLTVHFGNGTAQETQPRFSIPSIEVKSMGTETQALELHMKVNVPADFHEASLVLFLEPTNRLPGIKAEALVNVRPSKLETYIGGEGAFYSFSANLRPGNNTVQINMTAPAKISTVGAGISGWFRAKRKLASRNLTLVYKKGQRPGTLIPAEDLLPAASDIEKVTYLIFKQTLP